MLSYRSPARNLRTPLYTKKNVLMKVRLLSPLGVRYTITVRNNYISVTSEIAVRKTEILRSIVRNRKLFFRKTRNCGPKHYTYDTPPTTKTVSTKSTVVSS